jgi:hypothetical protein
MTEVGRITKKDCAVEGQQKFNRLTKLLRMYYSLTIVHFAAL